MLTLEERINVTELLSGICPDDLLSLASTITKGLLKPDTPEEANEAILLHSDTVDSILNRKKISRELIFKYLHQKKVTTDSSLDKKSLMKLLKAFWDNQCGSHSNNISQAARDLCENSKYSTITSSGDVVQVQGAHQMVSSALDPLQVDLLALKFAEWFYQLLNKDFLEGGNCALGPEHFWTDAYLQMKLNSNNSSEIQETEGSCAVVELMTMTKQQHKLYFSPNLTSEGVKGRSEPHAMVSVLVCGTLHQSAGVVVGIFEQVFHLIKDPLMDNTWKIKRMLLNLTSQMNIASAPTLSQGELTSSLLPIENPD